MDIRSVKYTSSDGNIFTPVNSSTSVENETLTLSFGEPIPVGEGSLEFHFIGELKDKMKGFYRSKYVRWETLGALPYIVSFSEYGYTKSVVSVRFFLIFSGFHMCVVIM